MRLLYSDGKPLDGRTIRLKDNYDRTVLQTEMIVEPALNHVFSTNGIRIYNAGAAPLELDGAYLSFSSNVAKWQRNAGCWQPSPTHIIPGWTTFSCAFPKISISPDHLMALEEFRGGPVPTNKINVKLVVFFGSKQAEAEFTIMPPR
jgi:hypothetical protein